MTEQDFNVTWICPDCKTKNLDNFAFTGEPLCSECESTFLWEDVLELSVFNQLDNKLMQFEG